MTSYALPNYCSGLNERVLLTCVLWSLKKKLCHTMFITAVVCFVFLDATKAFDRANYVKLFRILVEQGLPPYIIRVLINMYVTKQACVSWADIVSAYFPVFNGVRQGRILSSLLLCVYIDNLLLRLSNSGVGCYIGTSFVGALAYADGTVLLSPTQQQHRSYCQFVKPLHLSTILNLMHRSLNCWWPYHTTDIDRHLI